MSAEATAAVDMTERTADDESPMSQEEIYHEKQSLMLCAIHAVNNLLQRKNALTKKQFDDICTNLSPNTLINPHRNMFGLGNYDINVIMNALLMFDYETVWFDKRKELSILCLANIFGYLINIPSQRLYGFLPILPLKHHWIAVRRIGDTYYDLDSKLSAPQSIGQTDDMVLAYLSDKLKNTELAQQSAELLLVVTKDIAQIGSWKHTSSDS